MKHCFAITDCDHVPWMRIVLQEGGEAQIFGREVGPDGWYWKLAGILRQGENIGLDPYLTLTLTAEGFRLAIAVKSERPIEFAKTVMVAEIVGQEPTKDGDPIPKEADY